MTEQAQINPFRELNRYDDRDEDWPSAAVFEEPRRTLGNGWAKFHAARDCGARNVAFVENTSHRPVSDKYEYSLRCWKCGHEIDEDEVLFIGGEWFSKRGCLEYRNTLEDLWLPPERVLGLGPDPDQDELIHALNLSRIERNAGVFGLTFGNERYDDCEDCGHETFLTFDDRCRMCYDGKGPIECKRPSTPLKPRFGSETGRSFTASSRRLIRYRSKTGRLRIRFCGDATPPRASRSWSK